MKLIELTLKNFRQHRAFEYAFQDGVTAILGPNGAGKSSLVEALAFALYGSAVIRGKVEGLKTFSSGKQEKVEVQLTFEHAGAVYRLQRSTQDAELFRGGEPAAVATGTRAVTGRITELLGMNYQEFLSAYYTEQKGLEFLTGQRGATERERFILRMLGYDRLEKAQNLLREDRKAYRAEVQFLQNASNERAALVARQQNQEQLVRQAEDSYLKIVKSFDEAEEGFKKKQLEQVQQEKLRAESISQLQKIAVLKKQIEERELKLASFSVIEALELEPQESEEEISISLAALRKDYQMLKSHSEKKLQSQQAELNSIQAELLALQAQLKECQKQRANLQTLSAEAECPTCRQALGDNYQNIQEHLQGEEQRLAKQIVDMRDIIQPKEVEFKAQQQSFADSSKELERSIRLKEQLLNDIKLQLLRWEQQSQRLKEQEQIKIDLLALRAEYQQLCHELEGSGYSEQQYITVNTAFEAAQSLMNVARLQRVKAEGEVTLQRRMVEELRQQVDAVDGRLRQSARLLKEVERLEVADQILTAFRKELNQELKPRLAEIASDYLTEITDGRYVQIEINDSFEPQIVDQHGPLGVISGGEQDVLHLCMRLALSNLLFERSGHAFTLLILDEVFGALDENRRSNVLALLEKLSTQFEQVLLITHVDEVKDWVPNIINLDYHTGEAEE
jgi:DNA repair protein SbcC/Rad50